MQDTSPQLPTLANFASAVNTNFGVRHNDDEAVNFTLVECKSHISNELQECYSLFFKGPVDHPPVQDTYILENDQLGEMQLLLVPVKRDESGIYFEAVMNHLVKR